MPLIFSFLEERSVFIGDYNKCESSAFQRPHRAQAGSEVGVAVGFRTRAPPLHCTVITLLHLTFNNYPTLGQYSRRQTHPENQERKGEKESVRSR